MTLLDELKNSFQLWYQKIKLTLINKSYSEQLLRLPSENQTDYYYDELNQTWIYKDKITQVGFHNILNLTKIAIDSVEANIENLTAIITNINTISVDTTNLQAIITDIGTMNTNVNNLQAIITDIANIETLNTTISGNITTMNTNITNLQAIIADIANIETLNATISGNITSLTAIIANIGTMNTNIANLQAIISDIANIETQNISMNTALATINTNIGTINTAITNINAINAEIEINIEAVKDLDIDIALQTNKGTVRETSLETGQTDIQDYDTDDYLYNRIVLGVKNIIDNDAINVNIEIFHKVGVNWLYVQEKSFDGSAGVIGNVSYAFPTLAHIRIAIHNNSSDTIYFKYILFFSKNIIDINQIQIRKHIDLQEVSTSQHHVKTTSSEISLNNLLEKLHTSLSGVSTSQHHVKTTSSEISLNNLLEKLHASLSGVSTSQHHVKTIASELNLADLNEKSYNSLTNKPTIFEAPIGSIMMYSGTWVNNTTIVGWYKCDGNNGTVNLVDKFVRGGSTSGASGGSDDAVVVEHSHTFRVRNDSTENGAYNEGTNYAGFTGTCSTANTGVSGVGANKPAYYTLIFIQRIS